LNIQKTNKAEINSVKTEIQPGKESGRHMHPFPTYVHVLEGTLTVEFEMALASPLKLAVDS
jgi:quercetin dioxygenase-like cupin family protein